MAAYSSWESLTKAAQESCTKILEKEVAPVAVEIVKKHIISDIYDVYEPQVGGWINGTTYKRRSTLPKTVQHSFVAQDEILVTSNETASPSVLRGYSFKNRYPGAFLEMLEEGDMGFWRKGFPRPAISNAQDDINSSALIKNAIQAGIDKYFA